MKQYVIANLTTFSQTATFMAGFSDSIGDNIILQHKNN